jgi:hypothetical protein
VLNNEWNNAECSGVQDVLDGLIGKFHFRSEITDKSDLVIASNLRFLHPSRLLGSFRRQLHFEVPDSSGTRKRKGGTITPFGLRVGDLVKASKSKEVYVGYIGGFTCTDKTKNVSIYDYTWKRIGQFTPSKVKLLRRSNGLCVA